MAQSSKESDTTPTVINKADSTAPEASPVEVAVLSNQLETLPHNPISGSIVTKNRLRVSHDTWVYLPAALRHSAR